MSPVEIVSMMLNRHANLLVEIGRTPIDLEYKQIRLWREENRTSDSELTEAMAIEVAQRYLRREITYWPADWVMNNLFFALTSEPSSDFSEIFLGIYNAFDAGEFSRIEDQGAEPSETYTHPGIARILAEARRG